MMCDIILIVYIFIGLELKNKETSDIEYDGLNDEMKDHICSVSEIRQ